MRIDKFLKVSRIIKRRTVAKEICNAGRITLNGRPAKAGSEVKVGDILGVGYARRRMEVEVLDLSETVRATEAKLMYQVISDSSPDSDDF